MSVYLDNAATTRPCEPAVSAVFQCMVEDYGNPSSLHKLGLVAEQRVEEARKAIAAALVCDPRCITFTSGATECNNTAIFGAAESYGRRKKKIIVSAIEHPSVSEPIKYLEEKKGFEVVRIKPSRNGEISEEDFIAAVDGDTFLVSCMLVNNETGSIQPVRKIFSYVKRNFPECITHCDAVQGFMKIPIRSSELFADIIVVSGHKVHAVKGVGAMFVKKGIRIPPYLLKKLAKLDYVTVNSTAENRSPYITNFSVEGIRSEIMLHFLETQNVYVSSGSACSKGAHSSVLTAMGIPDRLADSAIRVSIGRTTTMGEIDALINAVQEGYGKLAKR